MKQKEKNIIAVDVGSAYIKTLVGSFNEPVNESKPFFELQGALTKIKGVSKRGTINNKKKFTQSVSISLDAITAFSGYEVDEVILSYTHPDVVFLKKTIGVQDIKAKDGIYITEKWLETQKEKILESLHRAHRHKRCTYFDIVSLCVDGEEVIYDPYEYTATKSLYMTYIYLLAPTAFIGTLLESIERFTAVRISQPATIANSALLSDEQKEQGIILCDIGAEFTNMVAYKNGVPEGMCVIPFGGNTITAEIALLKKIPLEEAEHIKAAAQSEGPILKKQDLQIIDKKIGALLKKDLLSRIKEIDSQKKFPNGIVLTGGGSLYAHMEKIIEKITGLHTFSVKIPCHIQSQHHMHQTMWHTAYATLYGIATRQESIVPYREKIPFWQRITGYIHALTKMLR